MNEEETGPFYVERIGLLRWEVRVRHYLGSYRISLFWMEESARKTAENLNHAARSYGWKEVTK